MTTGKRGRPTQSQIRAARRERRQRRRRLVRLGAFSAVGIVAAIFIAALFLPGLNLSFGGNEGTRGSGPSGPGVRVSEQGNVHIDPGQSHPDYNSTPATSGWHYEQPLAPTWWGIHDDVLEDEVRLHNLEHGGVGVHYNCPEGCDELVDQLAAIVGRTDKVIMSPYPSMDTRIALTAWTFIDKFEEFDQQRVEDFIRAHVSSPNAPEPNAR